jgi:hypothetical protein
MLTTILQVFQIPSVERHRTYELSYLLDLETRNFLQLLIGPVLLLQKVIYKKKVRGGYEKRNF